MVDYHMTLRPTETNILYIFLAACLVDSFPIGPERKHKSDFFASFYTTRPFSINYSISKFNGDPGH